MRHFLKSFEVTSLLAAIWAVLLALAIPSVGVASQGCQIISDVAKYYQRAEQSILLLQYGDVILRASEGKIRCQEEAENGRQHCEVEGPGEMLVESDNGLFVIVMPAQEPHVVHVYQGGDVSCALAADLQ